MSRSWWRRSIGNHKHYPEQIIDRESGEEQAGGSLPEQWDADGSGNATFTPDADREDGLGTLHIVAPDGAQDALTITDSENPDSFAFGIDPFGYILGTGADLSTDSAAVLKVAGNKGGTGDLFEVRSNTGHIRTVRVDRQGFLRIVNPESAPAPDEEQIAIGEVVFWFDPIDAKLYVKGRNSEDELVVTSLDLT